MVSLVHATLRVARMHHQTATGALVGRVAAVTGASSGIGQATAQALAREGARVALLARRVDQLEQVRQGIIADQGVAVVCPCDVANAEEVKTAIERAETLLGPVDTLVNCAGVMYYTMVEHRLPGVADRTIDVNCRGVVNTIEAALPGMIGRGFGHIVNVSSHAGRTAFPGLAVYTGTKFFVEGFSKALRLEVAPKNVKVTCVQPGDVRTPLQDNNVDDAAFAEYSGVGKYTMLEADDIAKAVVFALKQPDRVAVNEILVEPREAPA